jgi:hypothetical protein
VCTVYDDSSNALENVDVTNTEGILSIGDMTDISITNNAFTMGDVTFTLDEKWSDSWFFNETDGYFYCKNIVKVGATTQPLLSSVSIGKTTLSKINTENPGVSLEVDVLSDSIQTKGGAVAARWGDSAGVEIGDDGTLQVSTKASSGDSGDTENGDTDEKGSGGSDDGETGGTDETDGDGSDGTGDTDKDGV